MHCIEIFFVSFFFSGLMVYLIPIHHIKYFLVSFFFSPTPESKSFYVSCFYSLKRSENLSQKLWHKKTERQQKQWSYTNVLEDCMRVHKSISYGETLQKDVVLGGEGGQDKPEPLASHCYISSSFIRFSQLSGHQVLSHLSYVCPCGMKHKMIKP